MMWIELNFNSMDQIWMSIWIPSDIGLTLTSWNIIINSFTWITHAHADSIDSDSIDSDFMHSLKAFSFSVYQTKIAFILWNRVCKIVILIKLNQWVFYFLLLTHLIKLICLIQSLIIFFLSFSFTTWNLLHSML